MLDRLLSWIVDREPVASATGLAGVITAAFGVVAALGVDMDPELVAAVGVLVTALAGWLARKRAWSPLSVEREISLANHPSAPANGPQKATGEAGFAPILVLVFIAAAIIATFLAMDACFDDEDEEEDLGWAGPVATMGGDEEDNRSSKNRNGDSDCRDARAACSDDDFSPSFDKSPVEDSFIFEPHVCLPFSECHWDGERQPA